VCTPTDTHGHTHTCATYSTPLLLFAMYIRQGFPQSAVREKALIDDPGSKGHNSQVESFMESISSEEEFHGQTQNPGSLSEVAESLEDWSFGYFGESSY
jgi:hypothetical protein